MSSSCFRRSSTDRFRLDLVAIFSPLALVHLEKLLLLLPCLRVVCSWAEGVSGFMQIPPSVIILSAVQAPRGMGTSSRPALCMWVGLLVPLCTIPSVTRTITKSWRCLFLSRPCNLPGILAEREFMSWELHRGVLIIENHLSLGQHNALVCLFVRSLVQLS
jgi:hypothetical protein